MGGPRAGQLSWHSHGQTTFIDNYLNSKGNNLIAQSGIIRTSLGDRSVSFEHVFGSSDRRHFSCIKTLSYWTNWIVDSHVESSADSGALRINCSDAKDRGDGGVDCVSSIHQYITANKSNNRSDSSFQIQNSKFTAQFLNRGYHPN